MKKIIYILLVATLFASCNGGTKSEVSTEETNINVNLNDSVVSLIESIMHDTVFIEKSENDSIIIGLQEIEEHLIYEKFIADSLYEVFRQDSINFRKITKIINGGYNGWDHRFKLWVNAREVLKQYNDTVI